MFDSQTPLRPGSSDPATETGVGAILGRWVVEDPCPQAVAELAGIDPAALGDADRVRLLIGLERQSAWVCSLALPVLVAVGDAYTETVADARDLATERLSAAGACEQQRHGATDDPDTDGDGRSVAATVSAIFGGDPDRWATAEIAAALHIAEFSAGNRLELARALPVRLPLLDAALRAGRVSFGHVLLVARETEPLTDHLARVVDARLARRYGTATPGALRNAARHATIAADPPGAEQRHQAGARRRSLRTRPEHDSMATMVLFGPAPDVALVEAAVVDIANQTAAAAHTAGRLIADRDSLLADALVGLARHWLHDTWPIAEPDPRPHHPERPTDARATGDAGTPDDTDTPDDAGAPHEPGSPDDTSAPHEPDSPADTDTPDEPDSPEDTGRAEDPQEAADGRRDDSRAEMAVPVRMGKGGRRRRGRDHTVVNIVIDLPTLLGLADHPARLEGYGPIPAALARRLAADGAWRRMITDPTTRRLLDRSPRTYRPGQQLAAYVRARDLECDHPGCTRPAEGCQLDHDHPFDLSDPDGGRTVADDLHPRCQPHHNAKTHLGWQTGLRDDGTRYTRSPLGFDYTLQPDPYLETS